MAAQSLPEGPNFSIEIALIRAEELRNSFDLAISTMKDLGNIINQ